MDVENGYSLIPLVQVPSMLQKCIDLLNEEWPRSYASRENSMKRCMKEEPDLSYILIFNSDELIGHARLCQMPEKTGCWIESVIVRSSYRGRGIGKILMDYLEIEAKKFGFRKIYLSTHDKMSFYEKCGYVQCPPVLNHGSASKLLAKSGLTEKLISNNIVEKAVENKELPRSGHIQISNSNIPPPPPLVSNMNSSNIRKKTQTYYCKELK